jgi:hypothetical protein
MQSHVSFGVFQGVAQKLTRTFEKISNPEKSLVFSRGRRKMCDGTGFLLAAHQSHDIYLDDASTPPSSGCRSAGRNQVFT